MNTLLKSYSMKKGNIVMELEFKRITQLLWKGCIEREIHFANKPATEHTVSAKVVAKIRVHGLRQDFEKLKAALSQTLYGRDVETAELKRLVGNPSKPAEDAECKRNRVLALLQHL